MSHRLLNKMRTHGIEDNILVIIIWVRNLSLVGCKAMIGVVLQGLMLEPRLFIMYNSDEWINWGFEDN